MSRAKHTLILIQHDQLVRADFTAAAVPVLQKIWRQARPAEMAVPELVRAALKLGPRCGRNVWILCEDLWTQLLAFPVATVAGLDDAQLVRAFAFEAEPLSEIAGTDSALGYTPTDITQDMRSFWITATDTATRNTIQTVVREGGGRMAGMCHPGGLPAPLGKVERTQAWIRVELWQNTTFCLSGHGPARSRMQVFNAGSGQPRVQAGISTWIAGHDPNYVEVLEGDSQVQPASLVGEASRKISIKKEQDLSEWLTSWMTVLSGESIQAPTVAPAPQAAPKHLYALVAIAAELVIAAACMSHWFYIGKAKKTVLDELTLRRNIATQAADLDKSTDEARRELEKLAVANDETEKSHKQLTQEFAQQRDRIERLLTGLASKRPNDVVIQSISSDNANGLKIKGIALDSSLSDQLALSLSESLQSTGWSVQPLEKEGGNLLANGGPWTFTLSVRDPTANPIVTSSVPEPTVARRHR